jgi:hypothetical protein
MVSERAHTDEAIEFIRKIAGEMSALPYDNEHQGAFSQAAVRCTMRPMCSRTG